MKNRLSVTVPVFIFLLILGVLIYDISATHSEISRNSEVINDIEKSLNDIESDIAKT